MQIKTKAPIRLGAFIKYFYHLYVNDGLNQHLIISLVQTFLDH